MCLKRSHHDICVWVVSISVGIPVSWCSWGHWEPWETPKLVSTLVLLPGWSSLPPSALTRSCLSLGSHLSLNSLGAHHSSFFLFLYFYSGMDLGLIDPEAFTVEERCLLQKSHKKFDMLDRTPPRTHAVEGSWNLSFISFSVNLLIFILFFSFFPL